MQGEVTVEFVIGKDGGVLSARAVKSPDPVLSALAVDAVMRGKYEPGVRDGVPTAARLQVPITFVLGPVPTDPKS